MRARPSGLTLQPVPDDLLYVALGDSTGVGIGARNDGGYPDRLLCRLQAQRPAARLINLCRSGSTSIDVLEDQLPDALRLRPQLITLGIGINDVSHGQDDEAFANNLEEIAVRLAKLAAPIVIVNIPDLAFAPAVRRLVPPELYERRIEVMNRHLEATAARHRLVLVDLYARSREALVHHPEHFCADGFHPSDLGYEQWAEIMWPAVSAAVVREGGGVASLS